MELQGTLLVTAKIPFIFLQKNRCQKLNSKAVKQATPKVASAKKGVTRVTHKKTRSDYDWNLAKRKRLSKQHRKYFVHSSKNKQNTFSKNLNGFHQRFSNQHHNNFRQRKSSAKSECKFESHLHKPPSSKLTWVSVSH